MRWEVINKLIKDYNCKSYLEIGVQTRACFDRVVCVKRQGVDPNEQGKDIFTGDSDTFFLEKRDFDIVFIDGLHHADQVERDIINSWGAKVIVLHDCNPPTEDVQEVPRATRAWWGDVWRAFVGFRMKYPQVESYCYDFDCGVGVIIPSGKIERGFVTDMDWRDFDKNRKELLNLI